MSLTSPVAPLVDDIYDYPLHEEDDVAEGSLHRRWSGYLDDVLDARYPDWFVSGNVCVYWEPRNFKEYVAPDVFLAAGRVANPPPRVYRTWLLPRIVFVAEVGSVSTAHRGAKLADYAAHIRPDEVLYTEPVDEELGEMLTLEKIHLYRWMGASYMEIERLPTGRIWSDLLELEIGVDLDGDLRLFTAEGEPLHNYREAEYGRIEAEREREIEAAARVEAERGRELEAAARSEAEQACAEAEREREREAVARAEAEQARVESEREREREAAARAEAERQADEERTRREELERQIAALQARLADEQETT